MGDNFRYFFQLLKLLLSFIPILCLSGVQNYLWNQHQGDISSWKYSHLTLLKEQRKRSEKSQLCYYASSCWKLSTSSECSPRRWLPLGFHTQHSRRKRRWINNPTLHLPVSKSQSNNKPSRRSIQLKGNGCFFAGITKPSKDHRLTSAWNRDVTKILEDLLTKVLNIEDVKNKSNMSVCPLGRSLLALVGTGFMLCSQGCSHSMLCCTAAFHYSLL